MLSHTQKIELVKEPFVRTVAQTAVDPVTLNEFVSEHGLTPLLDDEHSPIAQLLGKVDGTIMRGAVPEGYAPLDFYYQDADLLAEFAGRFCYRAWGKGRSTESYLDHVISERHGNLFAHPSVSFIVTGVSRALTHELVRHHVGTNPSQESQRYVTAEGTDLEVVGYRATRAVVPPAILEAGKGESWDATSTLLEMFQADFGQALTTYNNWRKILEARLSDDMPATLRKKRINEAARAFLPNACETRLVWTMNLRAARNVIERRGVMAADLEIRRLAVAFAREMKRVAPLSFQDVEVYTAEDGHEAVRVEHYGC